MTALNLYISSDNLVTVDKLKDAESGSYLSAATLVMTLCKYTPLHPKAFADEFAVAEVQTLKPDNSATAGTWTLTYLGETTSGLAYDATAATVQTALEALSNIDSGDVTVSGDAMSASPVADGMKFTWDDTLGDVSLLKFDFSGLTGPTQAGSTMTETTKGVQLGEAVNEGGGNVGIPIVGNGLADSDYVRLLGFGNYDNEYSLVKAKENKIVIQATHQDEKFNGNEYVFVGVPGGCNLSLTYIGADGKYQGILPDTIKNLLNYSARQTVSSGLVTSGQYYLFIKITNSGDVVTVVCEMKAGFYSA